MEIVLRREIRTAQSTVGILSVNGKYECFTLEDSDRGLVSTMPLAELEQKKLKSLTAIPTGRYRVVVNYSNRFKRNLPLLVNVPGYAGIRIHPGNSAADTEGCILPGTERRKDWVSNSKLAFDNLYTAICHAINSAEQVFITVQ